MLGTRKAESSGRHARMAALESRRVRDLLSPNDSLPNALVYSPVENWSNDDVWTFLMQSPNPWGYSNKELLTMYQGASADGECPLVVDSSTPSCGDSRFGCWTCTLVEQDKSMAAMIQNDEEKEWMLPLLDLRNALDIADDRHLRDFRRMNGSVQLFHDRPIHGPYKQSAREDWLKRLLEAQAWIRENGPEYVRSLDLVTLAELEEIRRIWVVDKHEFEDTLPRIYEKAMGQPYPGGKLDEHLPLGADMIDSLRDGRGGGSACTSSWFVNCWTSSSAIVRRCAAPDSSSRWRRHCVEASTTTRRMPLCARSGARRRWSEHQKSPTGRILIRSTSLTATCAS